MEGHGFAEILPPWVIFQHLLQNSDSSIHCLEAGEKKLTNFALF